MEIRASEGDNQFKDTIVPLQSLTEVQALLIKNAKVYMAPRNKQKAQAAIADLKRDTGKDAVFLETDLADLNSIKRAVEQFTRFIRNSLGQVKSR